MIGAIVGFLTSLPQLLSMIQHFMGWVNRVSGNDPAGFLVKANDAFKQLSEAKTQEDHANAAKSLASLISGFPSK